ncbi:glycoside hydrolase [Corynebacterium sp. CCM 8835]|uniref:sialidase family protein n=1 Tax=Corynebacterium antarcticum TaxID=2800405 RepID=UPI001F424503|nr:sialidase family protein [Corynebacterium antarcticum]MCL0244677.1 glycoside hydrolase [Corynebacterium antarcticum]MCX7539767.1 sialidase family protein [Corynebacterium antarcticum]
MNLTIDKRAATGVIATLALTLGTLVSPLGDVARAVPPGEIVGFDVREDLGAGPFFTDEVLATGGENGFDCYRIPSLGVSKDGTVLASWDGRPGTCGDAPQPNSIVLRRSTDNGVTWTPQEELAAGGTEAPVHGYSDPSVLVDWYTGDVFNFHVKSYDVGIRESAPGTDPDDRRVLHAAYAKSTDNGATWETGTVITDQITGDAPWRGRFATSGNGIQLQYGEHAGRLVQPAMVVTDTGEFRAVTWLSDDHGESWFPGRAFGTGMDENKIVELSDGTLMDNSRSSDRSVLIYERSVTATTAGRRGRSRYPTPGCRIHGTTPH